MFSSDALVCILMGWALFWMLYGSFQSLGSAYGVYLSSDTRAMGFCGGCYSTGIYVSDRVSVFSNLCF